MCGYNSAREVGGVGCTTCPAGEAIPPPDPYRTRTEPGATSTTPVETLEGYVTQAEQNGGGWVQIVFHQICDGCGIYGVTADELSQFLDWLAAAVSRRHHHRNRQPGDRRRRQAGGGGTADHATECRDRSQLGV